MKILKGISIFLVVLVVLLAFLMTIYFLCANEGYGIDMLTELFKDGFIGGIKNFFIDIWKGILYVFKV